MDAEEIIRRLRERRLETLALAVQVAEDRWREPTLPGGRTLHDQLVHLLAWDEWATGVFDISALRALPPALVHALEDVDAFNARTETRYRNLTRDDVLSALQGAVDRVILSAMRTGGAGPWERRRIADLASPRTVPETVPEGQPSGAAAEAPRGPRVGVILRQLAEHEHEHAEEIAAAFSIQPDVERFSGEPLP